MEVEQRFRVTLTGSDRESIRTLAEMAGLIISRLPADDHQTVIDEVRRLAADQAGMPFERVHTHTHFVKDPTFD